jgi:hypothetical protein
MARSKSVSRSAAAKKASKTRKRRGAAKKAATTRKRLKVAGTVSKAKAVPPPGMAEIDQRIAIVRGNLRELTEQATAFSGSSTEELLSDRIAEQEARLELLRKQRERLLGGS